MNETTPGRPIDAAQVQAELHEVAERVRQARHLARPAQQRLADLLDEVTGAVSLAAPSAEMLHIAQTAKSLAAQLHESQHVPLAAAAREQLRRTVARLEVQAPVAADFARRLLDALTDLGI